MAGAAIVYCVHPDAPDSVLAISHAPWGCDLVNASKATEFGQSNYLHVKFPWKNESVYRRLSELLDSDFSLLVSSSSVV